MHRALVAVSLVAMSGGAALAEPRLDLDVGLLGGYTWTEQGQVTRLGPTVGIVQPVGPLTVRAEYSYLFWDQDYGHVADGREHWLGAAVQLDLHRSATRDRLSRAFVEGGAGVQ